MKDNFAVFLDILMPTIAELLTRVRSAFQKKDETIAAMQSLIDTMSAEDATEDANYESKIAEGQAKIDELTAQSTADMQAIADLANEIDPTLPSPVEPSPAPVEESPIVIPPIDESPVVEPTPSPEPEPFPSV